MLAMLLMVIGLAGLGTHEGPTRFFDDYQKGVDPADIFPPTEVQRLRALRLLPASGLYRPLAATRPTTRDTIEDEDIPASGVLADD